MPLRAVRQSQSERDNGVKALPLKGGPFAGSTVLAGNWTVGLYIDERASKSQFTALEAIFSGNAKGTTGLFRLLVGEYMGATREEVRIGLEGDVRTVSVGKKVVGAVQPVEGATPGEPLVVKNTKYWMGPDITVARSLKGKVRDLGRV